MLGPFTKGLMLLVLAAGALLFFVMPFIILYDMIKHKYEDEHFFAWALMPAWCVIHLAFLLDGLWYLIRG